MDLTLNCELEFTVWRKTSFKWKCWLSFVYFYTITGLIENAGGNKKIIKIHLTTTRKRDGLKTVGTIRETRINYLNKYLPTFETLG